MVELGRQRDRLLRTLVASDTEFRWVVDGISAVNDGSDGQVVRDSTDCPDQGDPLLVTSRIRPVWVTRRFSIPTAVNKQIASLCLALAGPSFQRQPHRHCNARTLRQHITRRQMTDADVEP